MSISGTRSKSGGRAMSSDGFSAPPLAQRDRQPAWLDDEIYELATRVADATSNPPAATCARP